MKLIIIAMVLIILLSGCGFYPPTEEEVELKSKCVMAMEDSIWAPVSHNETHILCRYKIYFIEEYKVISR